VRFRVLIGRALALGRLSRRELQLLQEKEGGYTLQPIDVRPYGSERTVRVRERCVINMSCRNRLHSTIQNGTQAIAAPQAVCFMGSWWRTVRPAGATAAASGDRPPRQRPTARCPPARDPARTIPAPSADSAAGAEGWRGLRLTRAKLRRGGSYLALIRAGAAARSLDRFVPSSAAAQRHARRDCASD
jgi:hypothetical protein